MISTAELHRIAETEGRRFDQQVNIDKIVKLFYSFTKHQGF